MRPAVRAAAMLAMIAAVAGCEFDERVVAPTASRVIVHSVLNPFASDYKVLVEELLTGRVDVDPDIPFREFDPIGTGSGVPIGDARVVIYNESGDSAVALEDVLVTRSTGMYRFQNSADAAESSLLLVPGATYRLKVTTPAGDVVTGTTTIPSAFAESGVAVGPFNRETDTLNLEWQSAEKERTYLIRVNSPRGPYHMFTDSQTIRLPGSLRDFFADNLPPVFVAGFDQILQVSAIDTNFYDYYRSSNNPFSGTGLINRLVGGTGLFGSLVPLKTITVNTFAPQDQPVEGEYTADVGFASNTPNRLSLYIETRRGALAQLSGNYDRQASVEGGGVLGFMNGSSVSLAFLRENLASDTLATFSGKLFGADSIVGKVPATGELVVYRKISFAFSSSKAPRTRRD